MINRAIRPSVNGEIKFNLPQINIFTLSNGIKVYHVEKNKLPIVNLSLAFDSGSKYDSLGKRGVSYLTSLLMDEGISGMNALDIDYYFDSMGSVFELSIDKDYGFASLLSIKENFQKSFELFSKIITEPSFNESDFEREHKKLQTKILQSKDMPSAIATKSFNKVVYDGTVYSSPVYGSEREVKALTNNDVKDFFDGNYCFNNCKAIIVGNITQAEIIDMFDENLSSVKINNKKAPELKNLQSGISKIYLIDKTGSTQTELRIGHISKGRNTIDFYDRYLANMILGGQFSSRLNHNLREVKGFTYGIHSSFAYYKQAASWFIDTAVEGKNTGEAISEILKEVNGVREEIRSEELEFAKSSVIKRFPLMFETYSQIGSNIALISKYDLPEDYFDHYLDNMRNVTLENVQKAAVNNFVPKNLNIIAVGDKELLIPQLEKISDLEIIKLDVDGKLVD